jgi:uncharacterized spore protein YtfJ
MNMHFEELLDRVTAFMREEATTETIVGKPFTLGEFNCIPVMRVGIGFGTGAGEGDSKQKTHGEGGGVGGGLGLEPIGFLASTGKEIQFVSTKANKGLSAAFEKVPEMIEKYMELRAKEREAEPAFN